MLQLGRGITDQQVTIAPTALRRHITIEGIDNAAQRATLNLLLAQLAIKGGGFLVVNNDEAVADAEFQQHRLVFNAVGRDDLVGLVVDETSEQFLKDCTEQTIKTWAVNVFANRPADFEQHMAVYSSLVVTLVKAMTWINRELTLKNLLLVCRSPIAMAGLHKDAATAGFPEAATLALAAEMGAADPLSTNAGSGQPSSVLLSIAHALEQLPLPGLLQTCPKLFVRALDQMQGVYISAPPEGKALRRVYADLLIAMALRRLQGSASPDSAPFTVVLYENACCRAETLEVLQKAGEAGIAVVLVRAPQGESAADKESADDLTAAMATRIRFEAWDWAPDDKALPVRFVVERAGKHPQAGHPPRMVT